MITFSEYRLLNENYQNLTSRSSKEQYADQVWDVLQSSYASIGGIKGSGFSSKEDMVEQIPYWKLFVKDGKVLAVILYKDSKGRKTVALGSDGSVEGKTICKKMLIDDIKHQRSYGEISGAPLHIAKKYLTDEEFERFFIKAKDAGEVLEKEVEPVSDYEYARKIGGGRHTKTLFGQLGKGFKGK